MYKQLTLSEVQLKKVIDRYASMIRGAIGKDLADHMFRKIGERLAAAPASAKVHYHNCFPGGLIEHSLRVYNNLNYLSKKFLPGVSENSLAIVALFHDLGKVGDLEQDYFLPQDNEWRNQNLGEYYIHNPNLLFMDTAQRSIWLLNTFGVPLTQEEYQAILIHDGQYIEANKRYSHKECMLALLLHQADMIACKQEQARWERFNNGRV
jgi:hypothetical protein